MGGSSFYIIYGFARGYIPNLTSFLPQFQQVILYKFNLALKLFSVGFCLLLFAFLLRYTFSFEFSFLLLLTALFLYFAIPYIFGAFYSTRAYNPGIASLIRNSQLLGEIAGVLAALLVIVDIGVLIHNRIGRREIVFEKEAPLARRRKFSLSRLLMPCWETPYCRDFLRDFCPSYNQKRSCWKVGGGCLCDEAIVNRLLEQTSVRGAEATPSLSRITQLMQKKRDCKRCPIYQEHQRCKYQLAAPFVPLFVIAIFWFGRGGIHHHYLNIAKYIDNLLSNLTYLPTGVGQVYGTLSTPWLETIILVIFALFLIGILLHLLEYFIFSMEW
ncbi:hypothetical protein H5T88_01930 [bacterium]|nr:hypothetical protein [bacterium]